MKVLFYNWTPFNTPSIGGGVAVYIKNLLCWLSEHKDKYNVEVSFLSSGYFYDNTDRPYIRVEKEWKNVKMYTLINSSVIAPLSAAATQLNQIDDDTMSKRLFSEFIKKYGPFDVIHFHSIEGLSTNVFELKKDYPNTRFIYSVHDYGLVCPNVKLWSIKNRNCYSNWSERDCGVCMRKYASYSLKWIKDMRPVKCGEKEKTPAVGVRFIHSLIRFYRQKFSYRFSNECVSGLRARNIDLINKYADAVLCVSKRVKDIMEFYGIKSEIVHVNYIGTRVAERVDYSLRTNPNSDMFTLLYMGYASVNKGFFDYLDTLEKLPSEECKCINLKFASKIDNKFILDRLEKLKTKYNSLTLYNGYTHEDFANIMKDVNLGIVPPLWEDNLPQVTIEMISNGIPVLTSSHGGAHELNAHPDFMFIDGELGQKIINIIHNRNLLGKYWTYAQKLTTMDEHVYNLMKIYKPI